MINYSEKITVVVPIYNVEEYLPRCLDSILEQTYTNIEIILVEDGSPDKSGVICDDYAAKDDRIRVFHISNGGVAKARQLGVEHSKGEYIIFVDPDDWLPNDSIEVLYSNMTDDVDIVIGEFSKHFKDSVYRSTLNKDSKIDNLTEILLFERINHSPWGKLFRKKLFGTASFPNVKKSQDWLMCIEVSLKSREVRLIEDVVYCYFVRENSTLNTFVESVGYISNFVLICKDILVKNDSFERLGGVYNEFVMRCILRLILSKQIVSYTTVGIRDIIDAIKIKSLSNKGRLIMLSLYVTALQGFIRRVVMYNASKSR